MAYNEETYANIKSRILASISSELDKREGSTVNDIVSPVSIEFAKTYIELDNLTNLFFLDGLSGDDLERKASEFGIDRKSNQYAEGVVKISASVGTTIAFNTIVSTSDGLEFVIMIDDDYTMETATVNLPVVANLQGRNYNIVVGAITEISPKPNEGITVTNEYIFQGGVDIETDEELLTRLKEHLQNPATSGNEAYYREKCLEITGVNQVKLLPRWDGNGTLKIIATYDNDPIPSYVLENLKSHIEENRVVDANITVVTPSILYVDISATVTLVEGFTVSQIIKELRDSFNSFFKACSITNKITYNKALSILLTHEDIEDYTVFTLDNNTSSITLNDETTAVVGKITINGIEG